MKRASLVVAVIFAAIGVLLPDRSGAQDDGFRLTGRVTLGPAGHPASGAEISVRLREADSTLVRLVAEDDGRFNVHLPDSLVTRRLGPSILQVHPNPVIDRRQRISLEYAAAERLTEPSVHVFDVLGRRIEPDRMLTAGIYYFRLQFSDGRTTPAQPISVPSRTEPNIDLARMTRKQIDVEIRVELPGHEVVRTYRTLTRAHPERIELQLSDTSRENETVSLRSPEGTIEVIVGTGSPDDSDSCLHYSVYHRGRSLLAPSALGLTTARAELRCNFEITATEFDRGTSVRRPLAGEHTETRTPYRSMTVELSGRGSRERALTLEVRAFEGGWALRYQLPQSGDKDERLIHGDHTAFTLPAGSEGFFHPRTQDPYVHQSLETRTEPTRWPLTLELSGDRMISILEATSTPHAWMDLTPHPQQPNTVQVQLAASMRASVPWTGPWRAVLVGDRPTDLIEQRHIVEDLVPPSRIQETSWIKPGTAMRVISPSTERVREHVRFAVREQIDYVELDGGWYGEPPDEADPRTARSGLDVGAVTEYAHTRDKDLILYVHHEALDMPIEDLFTHYRQWGVDGVKLGFVPVRTKADTQWLHRAIREAARQELVLIVHDHYVPQGLTRTYPHVLTIEGVRGNENWPTARQNTLLPFTRGLAGPTDYTPTFDDPRQKTTNAHQLALGVVIFSPIQFVYWYHSADYLQGKTPAFYRHLPTSWDESRPIDGTPGRSVAFARRRGSSWFVGAINGPQARRSDLPLDFLNSDRTYTGYLYRDDPDRSGRSMRVDTIAADAETVIRERMKAGGGLALRLVPTE